MKFSAIVLTALLVSGCGGSSSSDSGPDTPAPLPSTPGSIADAINIITPENVLQNQSVGLAAIIDTDISIASVKWTQIAGPQVFLATSTSQVIGFDASTAGDYQFELELTTTSGQTETKVASFSVSGSQQPTANIRLDHMVVEQGKVSLRVDSAKAGVLQDIQWQQTSGTTVSLSPNGHSLFFDAPDVTFDSLLEFQAIMTYEDGTVLSDNAYVLVKAADINSNGYFPKFAEQIVTTDVHPYVSNGPYADQLVDCVYSNQLSNSCTFATLPLIGQTNASPSIDDVLDRLVVSHDWMGDRFKQFLQQSVVAEDMLQLLGATTAIVISYDVRPSFYWSATGAIYLDANNFWITPQERDSLNDAPDFRAAFGSELQFFMPWRYVKNNDYYLFGYPAENRITREFSAVESSVSWLMYHELAHANDSFPPRSWSSLNNSSSPLSLVNAQAPDSDELSRLYPLTSDIMSDIAQVSFAGYDPTSEQKAFSASDITSFFEPDKAIMYYSYSTTKEDYAVLFERFMMAYRLGVSGDVAVVSTNNNDQLLVNWGQRNRISESKIKPRIALVVGNIMPQIDVDGIQQQLPQPLPFKPNVSWLDNLQLEPQPKQHSSMSTSSKEQVKKPLLWMKPRPHIDPPPLH